MLKNRFANIHLEAGVDEVGRGCLAGPVVAAAVILPKDFILPELKDSKLMSAKNRHYCKNILLKEALCYAIIPVEASIIDEINILQASFLAMHKAIEQLHHVPEHLLIDGNRFSPYMDIPHQCIVKGDNEFLSIAAASVLAKCWRDDYMASQAHIYPGYGWEKNVGYPTLEHKKAILKYGTTPLHRLTFNSSL